MSGFLPGNQYLTINDTELRLSSPVSSTGAYLPITWHAGGSEKLRLDQTQLGSWYLSSSCPISLTGGGVNQVLLMGTTTSWTGKLGKITIDYVGAGTQYGITTRTASTTGNAMMFLVGGSDNGVGSPTTVGYISHTATSTAYNTSSDYRLKLEPTVITGALAKNEKLKPCTWKWKADGTPGQGFIAHELQEIFPDAVTGKKDDVNEDGTPNYQGVDSSFLVAHLVACVQELTSEINSLKSQLSSLKK